MPLVEKHEAQLPDKVLEFIKANRPCYPAPQAVLIPVLMECQKYYGYISPEVANAVAGELGVAYAEVESVVSFYTMLLERPQGRYMLGVCCTWNCENAGSRDLVAHFEKKYGAKRGEKAADGLFTLDYVECLCDCHNAPSVQVLKLGEDFRAWWCNNLTVELFDSILSDIEAGKEDACRERLVRVEKKENPPDDKKWVWIVTTNNQYPAWLESKDGEILVHDAFGKLAGVKQNNPKLHAELQTALKG